jgi:hypothetical protein
MEAGPSPAREPLAIGPAPADDFHDLSEGNKPPLSTSKVAEVSSGLEKPAGSTFSGNVSPAKKTMPITTKKDAKTVVLHPSISVSRCRSFPVCRRACSDLRFRLIEKISLTTTSIRRILADDRGESRVFSVFGAGDGPQTRLLEQK